MMVCSQYFRRYAALNQLAQGQLPVSMIPGQTFVDNVTI